MPCLLTVRNRSKHPIDKQKEGKIEFRMIMIHVRFFPVSIDFATQEAGAALIRSRQCNPCSSSNPNSAKLGKMGSVCKFLTNFHPSMHTLHSSRESTHLSAQRHGGADFQPPPANSPATSARRQKKCPERAVPPPAAEPCQDSLAGYCRPPRAFSSAASAAFACARAVAQSASESSASWTHRLRSTLCVASSSG